MSSFEELNLIPQLLSALKTEGYEAPTPIQEKAIPHVLMGGDLLGCAQTGTGKTAAFALPIIQRLHTQPSKDGVRSVRALTLTPTRELAAQIHQCFESYGRNTGLRSAVIFGGVKQTNQVTALRRGVDILVATPGRLLDLIFQGRVDFYALEVFVLDEADRMLDMGFIKDVNRIAEMLPEKRQTLFFSATMPPEIRRLADNILTDPIQVSVSPPCSTVDLIEQMVCFVERPDKPALLAHMFRNPEFSRVLVFTRTKHGADKVARHLLRSRISTAAIHGDKTQGARENALEAFKRGEVRALVATDIASRGLDVDDVSHVINFDIPNEPESYIHRIGRTGRAGAEGIAISFCDATERSYFASIERLIKKSIRRIEDHPFKSTMTSSYAPTSARGGGQGSFNRGGGGPSRYSSGGGGGRGPGSARPQQGRRPQNASRPKAGG